jgi:hypothetical protein
MIGRLCCYGRSINDTIVRYAPYVHPAVVLISPVALTVPMPASAVVYYILQAGEHWH